MPAKFEVYKDKRGEFRIRLKAPNGETLMVSEEGYKTSASAKHGVESVKKYAAEADVIEVEDKKE